MFTGKLLSILLLTLLLSGCITSRYNISFQDPSFNLSELKRSPSLIVSTPQYVTLTDFQKTFEKVYQTNENFMNGLANNLTYKLKSGGYDVVADNRPDVYTKILEDTTKFISSNNAKFVICIRSAKIDQILTPYVMAGPPGTYGGGTQEVCKVSIEVFIVSIETRNVLMKFEVSDAATVSFWDYKATLENAAGKATSVLANKLLLKR